MQAWDALKRPIWMFDPVALRGVYANAAALDLWGSDNLDALLARDFSNVSPAVLARTERLARETANGETLTEDWTFYPHGRPLTVSAVISTYRLTDGTPVLLFEAAPITVENEERRAVEALRHTSTLITLFDSEARPIFSNPSAFAAYGSTAHPFEARFAEPERAQPMLAAALSGSAISDVCEIITREGVRWHHLDIRPVTDPVTGHLGVMLNEIDVTDRVEAEQARVAAEQKTAMAEARQKFLTDMSHELRTPLNAVIGFSDLLSKAGLAQQHADHAARINGAGKRLLSVVNDMIDLSSDNVVPLVPSDSPAAAEPAPPANEDAQALRVLYVDDHDSNRALVMAVLTAQGIACATANDGEQGVEAARTGDWDVILMDIQMPVMDGVEATRAIRALPGVVGRTPILALTANTLPEQLIQYEQAGMDDCIAKPMNIVDLVMRVTAWGASDWRTFDPRLEDAAAAVA
ncbi:CheY-like chemotaxis protein [Brevundimonas sp. UYEF29]|uniref:response regulator n=1 Tax=Brevundimonas sp. UYEF29 TaxID=3156346 RepID=UPI0033954D7B